MTTEPDGETVWTVPENGRYDISINDTLVAKGVILGKGERLILRCEQVTKDPFSFVSYVPSSAEE